MWVLSCILFALETPMFCLAWYWWLLATAVGIVLALRLLTWGWAWLQGRVDPRI